MDTAKLKKFAQFARRRLIEEVSAKLILVLAEDSAARRESTETVKKLEEALEERGNAQVAEQVAYIWFNRFCALRFMDVNRYTRVGIVSPAEGQSQPEILAEAKLGHIDNKMVQNRVSQQIFDLLDEKAPSRDPQGEAYRLLLVAACNSWHKAMPFLFQRIDDYTELLIPDDLLSGNSILAFTRDALTPNTCKDVEVIGWLYQFYISEKKDEVFAGLKKKLKITPENIPAATQLFTPHWIVRYLVENSLGRMWMLNRPGSNLIERMVYYIKSEQAETDFPRIGNPEEMRICDPACGSGHMLTYAFDLLYAIYEEEGYESTEIPTKILTNNLYGIEIDERAGELAAFALTMKARARQRQFFNRGIAPNICVLESVRFEESELKNYMEFIGRDLFTTPLQTTLQQFEGAKNFGSLIRPNVAEVDDILRILEAKDVSGQLFLRDTHRKVLQTLRQVDYLSTKNHVVIANPPYMGRRNGMNSQLKSFINRNFSHCKADLYAAFLQRAFDLSMKLGYSALVTMQSWMFLSSYKGIRQTILGEYTIKNMAHLGARAFPEIGGEVVQVVATAMQKASCHNQKPVFIRLTEYSAEDKETQFHNKANRFIDIEQKVYLAIPDSPVTYWLPRQILAMFSEGLTLENFSDQRQGLATGDDRTFLRCWHEVERNQINWNPKDFPNDSMPWYKFLKGGSFRKWYGNNEYCLKFDCQSFETLSSQGNALPSRQFYLRESLVWSDITSASFGARYNTAGKIFATGALSAFPKRHSDTNFILGYLNCAVHNLVMSALSSGIHYSVGYVDKSPMLRKPSIVEPVSKLSAMAVNLGRIDWDSYETSWDFTSLPLLNPDNRLYTLKANYLSYRTRCQEMTLEMQKLEEENNRTFINAYGLQDELTPEVPLNEVTLTCNPHYRYRNVKNEDELEALLLADTMRELVSYAVGCMFGRYALDKSGLILANQSETIEDYINQVPEPSFPADDDNVIPMLDGDWFPDDIAERFFKFLRMTFGEEHYDENLRFVEQALNIKGKRAYSIRNYFLSEFYADHVIRYKKRPIYWLFSSPKGSFNALIYMHRYRSDTVSVVLNDYLREFRTKLTSHKNHLEAIGISAGSSQSEKTKALKEIEKTKKMIIEMEEYERDILYPLATQQIEIDLDDGVKANYPKFGNALRKVPGLSVT